MSTANANPPALVLGLCTFNRGRRIVETLEAIVRMDRMAGRVSRLIVVDNNSTDGTGRVVDDFARNHPELSTVRIVERVQGIGAARARFFREASEPYLAMLDDDVLPEPDWAAAMIRALDARPRAGWVGGRIELQWEAGPTRLARRFRTMLAHQDFGDEPRALDRPDQGMASAAFAARREAILATGWLEERTLGGREGVSLESGEDYEICIRMRKAGWMVWYEPGARVGHLIPERRQRVEYLAKLARGVSLSKAQLRWLAEDKPGLAWAMEKLDAARGRRVRSRLLEWRPGIRSVKLAEHDGRVESWERLVQALEGSSGPA